MDHLRVEAWAPAELFVDQLNLSAFISVSVGTRQPVGQGLFTIGLAFQRLMLLSSRQSLGWSTSIKSLCPGLSVSAKVSVVPLVLI